MIDYSDKTWLQQEPFSRRVAHIVLRMIILAMLIFALASIISINESRAASLHAVLFENSSVPISFEEAERTFPSLGRPLSCRSQQSRTNEPWHHRTCFYRAQK